MTSRTPDIGNGALMMEDLRLAVAFPTCEFDGRNSTEVPDFAASTPAPINADRHRVVATRQRLLIFKEKWRVASGLRFPVAPPAPWHRTRPTAATRKALKMLTFPEAQGSCIDAVTGRPR